MRPFDDLTRARYGLMGAFRDLMALYIEGGILVSTTDDTGATVFVTLIQPDADIVMKVNQDRFNQPHAWQKHLAKLNSKIDSIHNLRYLMEHLWLVVSLLFIGSNIVMREFRYFVISLLISAAILLLRLLFGYLFRWYLRWAIRRFTRRSYNAAK